MRTSFLYGPLHCITALFDEFLGRVNDISEQTGATDFEDVIPILQREIPGLRVYELAEEEGDGDLDDEPSLEDFRDVEGNGDTFVMIVFTLRAREKPQCLIW